MAASKSGTKTAAKKSSGRKAAAKKGLDSNDPAAVREEEIRQMIQARSDRGVAKGRAALDVDAEVDQRAAAGALDRMATNDGPA